MYVGLFFLNFVTFFQHKARMDIGQSLFSSVAVTLCTCQRSLIAAAKPVLSLFTGDSVAEWLACWTQAQKGPGSNRSRDAIG